MIRALFSTVLLLLLAGPVSAQGGKPLFKYGKWVLAAGSLGLNYLAAKDHDRADNVFNTLEQRCLDEHDLCNVGGDGRYFNPEIEGLYQQSLHYDRRARRLLFGGEGALLGSAAIFVWELTRHISKPDNIPFEPEVRSLRHATGVGLRLRF